MTSSVLALEEQKDNVHPGLEPVREKNGKKWDRLIKSLKRHNVLYLMVVPGLVYYILFKVVPILGSVIAFQDYRISRGIFGSEFAGFKHFISLFNYYDFKTILRNTVIIASYDLIFAFPAPILLALLFNEVKNKYFKRTVQTVSYLPHFMSWVIVAGLTFSFLSTNGLLNVARRGLFGLNPVLFMQKSQYFRAIVVITSIWKEAGWGSIIILAAITNINPEYYEAAIVDGAGKLKQARWITFPLILPTIVILFLLRVGRFLELGFDQIFNLLTPMTYSVGDVLDTYVYRVGILNAQYSSTTAIGLFQSVIGFILIYISNKLSRKYLGGGIW